MWAAGAASIHLTISFTRPVLTNIGEFLRGLQNGEKKISGAFRVRLFDRGIINKHMHGVLTISHDELKTMSGPINPDHNKQESRPGTICVCKFLVWATVFFPFLAVIVFLMIPATMPPRFDIGVSSALSFDISSSLVVTSWNISLFGRNPASLFRVKYSHVTASLSIDSAPLCPSSVVPGFTQATRSTYEIVAHFRSVLAVMNDVNGRYLVAALSSGRDITNVEVNVMARRRAALGPVWVPVTDLSVWCADLVFSAGTDDNVSKAAHKWMLQLGGLGACDISFLDVI
ncbi:hypothetical protein CDL15_Pgr024689 [Punica granatum]|uniref:Late embryogenesis abundant protein LEA-2 subgroup domain-containing protein n=1 Tax=Punica granatum TaxID=22663 RepID=A0A218W417_PUNGR|nr:hypothetical protein CDL15_Pgr024689 [Punica granatum]